MNRAAFLGAKLEEMHSPTEGPTAITSAVLDPVERRSRLACASFRPSPSASGMILRAPASY